MNTISLTHRQYISLKERRRQPQAALHKLSQQLVQQVLGLVSQLEQLELGQEPELLEVWAELVLAWEELVQVLIHLQEWEAWAECQCSLVWQQAVDHPEWEEWVEQTWIHK